MKSTKQIQDRITHLESRENNMIYAIFSGRKENEFHKDDTINDLIKFVRNTKHTEDAICNAERILNTSYKRLPFYKKLLYLLQ